MRAIVIVDSSVFSHLIEVAENTANSPRQLIHAEFRARAREGDEFLLPIATIIETGNLVVRGHGQERRETAQRYSTEVTRALDRESPFTTPRFFNDDELRSWLEDFPDRAMEGKGIGDVSLIEEWERLRRIDPRRRIRIWSYDRRDLEGYDTHPD